MTKLLAVVCLLFAAGSALGAVSSVSAAPAHRAPGKPHHHHHHHRHHGHCGKHGYRGGSCTDVSPGQTVTIPLPGLHGISLSVTGQQPNGTEVVVAPVAAPSNAPAGAVGVSISAYDPVTNQPITTFNPPMTISSGTVYAYNPKTGRFTALPKNPNGTTSIYGPGIYFVVP